MYTITIKNYYLNGRLNKNETVLYTIPIQEDQIENVLTDPSVSCDLGRTGTFEFTVHPNHPYYHALAQMRTIMRVDYDGDTIFRGRILTIDNTMSGAKKVHCEGDMAFLLDSFQMGSKKETRDEITLNAYINKILNEHNRQMMEEEASSSDGTAISGARISGKEIYPGYIPGAYPDSVTSAQRIENKKDKFGSDSSEQTMNALESLTKEFGGFFRTRYSARDGKTYLDWCKLWFREDTANSQPIAIAQNIIDANSNSEVDNIFTAVIPIGSNKGEDVFITGYRTDIHGNNNRILVPQITKVYTESQLNNGYVTKSIYERAVSQYGIIYKVQKFQNADTQEKLWEYACDWIKNNYVGGITSYDLSAVDMHHVDNHVQKYLAGDCVSLTIHSDMTELDEYNPDKQSNTVRRTLLSVKYDLHHPDKNKYTAGIPSDILNLEYGIASTSKGGGKGGAGAKGGGGKKTQEKIGGDSELTEETLNSYAWKYVIDATHNNELYDELMREDPSGTRAAAAQKSSHVSLVRDIRYTEVQEDGSKEEKLAGMATTLKLDAEMGLLQFATPVINLLGVDAWGNKLTELKVAKSLEIDGYNGYINVKGVPSYRDTYIDETVDAIGKGIDIVKDVTAMALDPLNVLGIKPGKDSALMQFFKGSTENDKETTASVNGSSGFLGAIGAALGLDGSGDPTKATIKEDGKGNGGKGTVDVGKKNGQWLIQMNKPLQYSIEGHVYTLPDGTIDSKELSMLSNSANPIPSFSTKFASIDNAIIGKASIADLSAANANIDTLTTKVANLTTAYANCLTADSLNTGWSMAGNLSTSGLLSVQGSGTLSVAGAFKYHGNTIQLLGQTVVVNATTGQTKTISYLGTS